MFFQFRRCVPPECWNIFSCLSQSYQQQEIIFRPWHVAQFVQSQGRPRRKHELMSTSMANDDQDNKTDLLISRSYLICSVISAEVTAVTCSSKFFLLLSSVEWDKRLSQIWSRRRPLLRPWTWWQISILSSTSVLYTLTMGCHNGPSFKRSRFLAHDTK